MKNLLVPTDLSQSSMSALKYASEIAAIEKPNIHLIHISFMPSFYINSFDNYKFYDKDLRDAIDRIKSVSELKLKEFIQESSVESANIVSEVILGYSVHDEIINYSKKIKPGIIVMGSHSERKGSVFNIGSNTERIIRTTEIPVLVVRKNAENKKIRKVVYASEFDKNSDKVYSFLDTFLKPYKPEIHLLYINTKANFRESDDILQLINNFKNNFEGNFNPIIRAATNIDEGIVKYADSVDADLIALGVKRRSALSLYLTDRITEGVINSTNIPVLAIDNPK